jgi:tetratricopeptide (TPR) repeat protein
VRAQEAFEAFRRGDSATAVERLRGNLDRSANARHEGLQLASELVAVGSRLRGERLAQTASQAAELALASLAQARGQMSPRDSAPAFALEGQICDHFLNDRRRAIDAYQRALAVDPGQRLAAERLAHLRAVEELARQKTEANDLLRRRAAQPKR